MKYYLVAAIDNSYNSFIELYEDKGEAENHASSLLSSERYWDSCTDTPLLETSRTKEEIIQAGLLFLKENRVTELYAFLCDAFSGGRREVAIFTTESAGILNVHTFDTETGAERYKSYARRGQKFNASNTVSGFTTLSNAYIKQSVRTLVLEGKSHEEAMKSVLSTTEEYIHSGLKCTSIQVLSILNEINVWVRLVFDDTTSKTWTKEQLNSYVRSHGVDYDIFENIKWDILSPLLDKESALLLTEYFRKKRKSVEIHENQMKSLAFEITSMIPAATRDTYSTDPVLAALQFAKKML